MKRLRWHFGEGIRFFQCGEYGEQLLRPHHHALFFGLRLPDAKFYKTGLFTSSILDRLWGHGFCSIGAVSFESAAYVARYSLKKVTGPASVAHYGGRIAEYLTMSRRPGIGREYAKKFLSDFYPSDQVIVRGKACRPPRFYDAQLEKLHPSVLQKVKAKRRKEAAENPDNTGSRLIVREEVKSAALKNLTRSIEGIR